MKNISLLLLLLLLFSKAQSQNTDDKSGTVKISKSKPLVAVEANKMNILYIGLVNPLTIAVEGISSKAITVSSKGASIHGSDGKYTAQVTSGASATIYVYNGQTLLDSTIFRIRSVPNPVPGIAGKTNGDAVFKEELIAASKVEVLMDNFYFDLNFTVVSFTMASPTKEGGWRDETTNGCNLTATMKNEIQSLKRGNKIYFEDCKVKKPDGRIVNLGNIMLTIK